MSRQLKFRGKRVDNGEWVCGYLFSYGINSFIVGEKDFICYENNSTAPTICELRTFGNRVIPETVGQFTGLNDKYGKEIYEGDICKFRYFRNDYVGKVVFNQKTCGLEMWNDITVGAYGERATNTRLLCHIEQIEIIGNIYKNPKLMEVTNND